MSHEHFYSVDVLQPLLRVVGYLATAAVLILVDRFLDSRLDGSGSKMRGPVPFWWALIAALPLDWVVGMATVDSPYPIWAQVVDLAVLLIVAAIAFCLRFGMRPQR